MKSVDKLRDYASRNQRVSGWMTALSRIADEIEAEIAERYMELPVDADGVPIRVYDKLIAYNKHFSVEGIGNGTVIYLAEDGELGELFNTAATIHVKPRTLEDVLREFAEDAVCCNQFGSLYADEKRIAEYADEIRELLGGDAE